MRMVVTSSRQGHTPAIVDSREHVRRDVEAAGDGVPPGEKIGSPFFFSVCLLCWAQGKRKIIEKPRLVGERVLQAVAQDEADGKALALLVGTGAGLRREDAAQLVKHPVLGGIEPLKVLLGSARHCGGWGGELRGCVGV